MTQPADARPGGTSALAGPAAPEHRWLILGVIALAQLMIVLDATIMNIALPTAQRDLGFSIVDRQWVVTAYALAFGSLLLLGGKLADLPGAALVSGGMFCLVYGFSNAALHSWHTASTWGFLATGVILLAGFAWRQTRAPEPLLPPRIVADRNRSGAYLTMLIAATGMF